MLAVYSICISKLNVFNCYYQSIGTDVLIVCCIVRYFLGLSFVYIVSSSSRLCLIYDAIAFVKIFQKHHISS